MKEKFTPGPWGVEENGGHRNAVATCYGETWVEVYSIDRVAVDAESVTANAHLIAAAPEMYEALDRISRRIQAGTLDEWSWQALVDLAERALKKARGES